MGRRSDNPSPEALAATITTFVANMPPTTTRGDELVIALTKRFSKPVEQDQQRAQEPIRKDPER